MAAPIEKFQSVRDNNDFLFAVFYRGHWCPFCKAYIRDLEKIVPQIRAAHGEAIIITSEDEKFLPDTLAATKFSGETIVDTDLALTKRLKELNLLSVHVTQRGGYPHGMTQPAVLVLDQKTKKVLYSWVCVPSMSNLGGASDRPSVNEIWQDVQKIQAGQATKTRDNFKRQTAFGVMRQAIFS